MILQFPQRFAIFAEDVDATGSDGEGGAPASLWEKREAGDGESDILTGAVDEHGGENVSGERGVPGRIGAESSERHSDLAPAISSGLEFALVELGLKIAAKAAIELVSDQHEVQRAGLLLPQAVTDHAASRGYEPGWLWQHRGADGDTVVDDHAAIRISFGDVGHGIHASVFGKATPITRWGCLSEIKTPVRQGLGCERGIESGISAR